MAIIVKENNNATFAVAVKSGTGAVQNISGWSFQFRVSALLDPITGIPGAVIFDKFSSDITQINITNAGQGLLSIFILPADTNDKVGAYKYELKATDNNGAEYTLNGPGDFQITRTII